LWSIKVSVLSLKKGPSTPLIAKGEKRTMREKTEKEKERK
jgi:hypothetical protein